MEIKHKFNHVQGNFETETGKIVCVPKHKYSDVSLCFKANMNIAFANIVLHSNDLAIEAQEVFEDATNLGNEIEKRWNEYPKIKAEQKYIISIVQKMKDFFAARTFSKKTIPKGMENMRFVTAEEVSTYLDVFIEWDLEFLEKRFNEYFEEFPKH